MLLEQLDLFGNPVLVDTSRKEKLIVVQQPLFATEVVSETPQYQPLLFSEQIATKADAPMPNAIIEARIDAFKIEKTTTVTALLVPKASDIIIDIPDDFVYTDNNIRVKVKAKSVKTVVEEPVALPKKRTELTPISNFNKRGRKSYKDAAVSADLINIPTDDILKQKLYYGITEVANWFNVNVSQIRFWENEFDILQPRKTKKGDRLFRVEDIKNLELIYHLIRQRKFSIEGAKAYLKDNKQTANTNFKLVQSLTKFRSFLLELKANLGT
jgi:DNA-binding transcriptional MerR regulator